MEGFGIGNCRADRELSESMFTIFGDGVFIVQKFDADQRNRSSFGKFDLSMVILNVSNFAYDPTLAVTADSLYGRYEDISIVELALHDGPTKVRLLLRKLGLGENERYGNFITGESRVCSFSETVDRLTKSLENLVLFFTVCRLQSRILTNSFSTPVRLIVNAHGPSLARSQKTNSVS